MQIGQPQCGLQSSEPCHRLLGQRLTTRKGMAHRRGTQRRRPVGPHLQRTVGPGGRLIEVAKKEVTVCNGAESEMHQRVQRTETHGSPDVLDGHLGLSSIDVDPATALPCHRKVRIQSQGMIDQGDACADVAHDVSKRVRTPGQRDGIRTASNVTGSLQP